MTGYFKCFLATISVAFVLCVYAGCDASRSNDGLVNLRKVSDRRMSIHVFYDNIEVVCLDNVSEDAVSPPALSGLFVARDRFYFRDGDRAILSYWLDGHLADSLNPGVPIMDYSIYQERIIDILSGDEVLEYSVPGFSPRQKTLLESDDPDDSGVIPVKLARQTGDKMILLASRGNKDYLGEYYYDTKKYYVSPGKKGEGSESVSSRVQFLRYGDRLLTLYPNTGQLWEQGEFLGHFLWLDFKLGKKDMLEFVSAQVTDEKVYYSLLLNGEMLLLTFNRADRRYTLVKATQEGLSLPLGIIRDGINYFGCPSKELSKYLKLDLLDSQSSVAMDRAIKSNSNVVIKYHLATR